MKTQTYTAVAIVLHWAIALMILFNIPLGWWMGDAIGHHETAARAIVGVQVHKSIGLTVLALSCVRIAWRFTHTPPPLPAQMPAWEKLAANAAHWALYVLMFVMPLTGWLYVSTGWSPERHAPLMVPTIYFNLFEVPRLFGLDHAATPLRAGAADVLMNVHGKLAWVLIPLAALHVGAALKHWLVDRDEVLSQMVPGAPILNKTIEKPPSAPNRRAALLFGAGLIVAFFAFAMSLMIAVPVGVAAAAPEAAPATQTAEAAPEATPPAAAASAATSAAPAPAWRVNTAASAIHYSGVHAGVPFTGRFARWQADIRFAPDNLAASAAVVTIQAASASDGVALHDQSLPQAEWLDAAGHPTISFRTTSFRHRSGDAYEARGTVTLKGHTHALTLPFTLTINGDHAVMDGHVSLDRATYDLGMQSDADAEFVSRAINLSVHVEAQRAP